MTCWTVSTEIMANKTVLLYIMCEKYRDILDR